MWESESVCVGASHHVPASLTVPPLEGTAPRLPSRKCCQTGLGFGLRPFSLRPLKLLTSSKLSFSASTSLRRDQNFTCLPAMSICRHRKILRHSIKG